VEIPQGKENMSENQVIAEAITSVVAVVPTHLRESIAELLGNLASAQYQLGVRDGMARASELVGVGA
jgi:hypothetical protein